MSLDPSQYSEGRRSCFKVEIENIDSRLISILFSPHLADLQPEDPASKFSYFELQVSLSMGGRGWETNPVAGAKLYGKEDRPETIFTLHPGEGYELLPRTTFVLQTIRLSVYGVKIPLITLMLSRHWTRLTY